MDIRRKTFKKSHIYYNVKTKKRFSKDSKTAKHIDSLRIPPAYKDVTISADRGSKVQATGIDSKGRKQYIYSEKHKKDQTKVKFSDLIYFGRHLKKIRKDINTNLLECCRRNTIESLECQINLVLFIVDNCNFRVGSEKYKKLYKSYGVTTINSKHLTIKKIK